MSNRIHIEAQNNLCSACDDDYGLEEWGSVDIKIWEKDGSFYCLSFNHTDFGSDAITPYRHMNIRAKL